MTEIRSTAQGARVAIAATLALMLPQSVSSQELGEIIPPIDLSYYASDFGIVFEQGARVVADEWRKLGLDIKLDPIQFSTFVSTINVGGGLVDAAYVSVGSDPDRIDPTYWLFDSSACGQRRNASKWCDEEFTKQAELQRSQVNVEERMATVKAMQEYHFAETPWWPVTHGIFGMIWNSDKWENVQSSAPMHPAETQVNPWLHIKPTTDDRILDWGISEDVSTYNPMAEEGATGWMRLIYDTFGKIDSNGVAAPWAAQSWEFVDDTTLRLSLRDDMVFHDGEPVTAEDAVFTLSKSVEIQPPAMAARLANIDSVTLIDDYTFEIGLKTPDGSFVTTALPFLFILPEHLWSDYDGDFVSRDVIEDGVAIGSGPFSFKLWRRNEVHELVTHTGHWAAPEYDGIRRLALGQADAIRSALISGAADIAVGVLPQSAMSDLAGQNSHLDFLEGQSYSATLIWLNNEKAPFNDLEFRKALRSATNKQRVVIEAYQGFSNAAGSGPIPNQIPAWYNSDLPIIPFDIDVARQTLADAGYGWDSQGRLHFPTE